LDESDLILLLLSSDFIASDFAYRQEMLRALERHDLGQAQVVPILLRPMAEIPGPYSRLQRLPSTAVTEMGIDRGFTAVAEGVAKIVDQMRMARLEMASRGHSVPVMLQRVLDAAVSGEIPVGQSREVVVVVRRPDSEGLRLLLEQDAARVENQRTYTARPADVRSANFNLPFSGVAGAELTVRVDAPDCTPSHKERQTIIPAASDAAPLRFFVKSDRLGLHLLEVELLCDESSVAGQMLRTQMVHQPERPPGGKGALIPLAKLALRFLVAQSGKEDSTMPAKAKAAGAQANQDFNT
jgi:hypothetical protein